MNKKGKSSARLQGLFLVLSIAAMAVVAVLYYRLGSKGLVIPSLSLLFVLVILDGLTLFFIFRSYNARVRQLNQAVWKSDNGDLTVSVTERGSDELAMLAKGLNQMIRQSRGIISEIGRLSDQVGDAARTLVSSVEEHTASASEIGSTISEIASGATNQAELMDKNRQSVGDFERRMSDIADFSNRMKTAAQTLADASAGNQQSVVKLRSHSTRTVRATADIIDAVTKLDGRSKNVGNMIQTISDIADQTNLLALNASIEAAHAGEQGKGFAVVAAEIRKLSNQTNRALDEMSELMNGIRSDTKKTVSFAGNTSRVLEDQFVVVSDIETNAQKVAKAVAENQEHIAHIAAAVQKMAEENKKIKQHLDHMAEISEQTASGTEEVTASVEEQTAGMEQLSHIASGLEKQASDLRGTMQHYKIK
ncbi:MAG: methyl-accepting chemotaxis protein [Sporolactobacillus sp.]|jgi:methyl-accepting chemotaxis protein|nr:methyl-accepting chemotaxis protein [Sporolactobacillus sp.]